MERHDAPSPSIESQVQYWDYWNASSRLGTADGYMRRLCEVAKERIAAHGPKLRILEVGCGTGWLSASLSSLGTVVGVDVSPAAIQAAKQRGCDATFLCGDFSSIELPGPFDVVLTADTIAHVPDQAAFIDRVAQELAPGGMFLLMTQNPFVLRRCTWVQPPAPGQIRRWPAVSELRSMLAEKFRLSKVTSASPLSGSKGVLRILNARKVWAAVCGLLGEKRATKLYEGLGIGQEMVLVAYRR